MARLSALVVLLGLAYRTDLPGGLFGKMARKVAEDGAQGSTERYLKATQGAIETYFRNERGR